MTTEGSSRRKFLTYGSAFIGATTIGMAPRKAEAFAFLALRFLGMGRIGAAGAARIAGRTSIRGTAPVRPIQRPQYNQYSNTWSTVQGVWRAGRFVRSQFGGDLLYADPDEYHYDVARYPHVFEAIPTDIHIENAHRDCGYYMPTSDLELDLNDGQVWQAYSVPELYVPPGGASYRIALPGVPRGWSFTGCYSTPIGCIHSDFVS